MTESFGIPNARKQRFGIWMFPSSEVGRNMPTLLGPLDRVVERLRLALSTSATLCFLVLKIPDVDKAQKPIDYTRISSA
jgi:hypothetical protein